MKAELMEEDTPQTPTKKIKRKFFIESVVKKQKTLAEPVFAKFTNGKPAEDVRLQGDLYQEDSQKIHHRNQRIMRVETPWLDYVGKNSREYSASTNESVYIGILDKSKGTMKLVEASTFILNPEVTHLVEDEPSSVEETYEEKQDRIVSQFGSKKAKQVLKQRKMFTVNSEGMTHAMQEASTDVQLKEEDLNITSMDQYDYLKILPEFNDDAKTPEDVYKLEWIAPDHFLANFENTARSHIEGETEFDETNYCQLTLLIATIGKCEDDEENKVRMTCLALYVEYLTRMSLLRSHHLRKPNLLEGCPRAVKSHILHTYANMKDKVFSQVDKDRVLCLILVLGLIGCKYEVCTKVLVESLHIDLKKLHLLMRAIGATYINDSLKFKLKFPLTKIANSGKRKKGRS